MPAPREKLDALLRSAQDRGLTPRAWWLGTIHHAAVLDELGGEQGSRVEAGRLVELDGIEVKLLSESPDRFALFCDEGILDL